MALPHLSVDLLLRHERRHGVDHDHVDRARAHQDVDDLERLLPRVGLRDQQVLGLDPDVGGVDRIQGVLGVDEGGDAAALLGLGDDVERERRLAGRFRPVDLDHPPSRDAAHAQGQVEGQGASGDHVDVALGRGLSQLHDGPLSVGAFDLAERGGQGTFFFGHLLPSFSQRPGPR